MAKSAVIKTQRELIKEALLKIGIKSDEELREAIRSLPPLSISIMTDPIAPAQRKGDGTYG
ncbi:MAG: hypothetical protein NC548_26575 [Lachnospiraceae bacterium]|nr:hypothetical protein [Lachnospiraceae bacterium]